MRFMPGFRELNRCWSSGKKVPEKKILGTPCKSLSRGGNRCTRYVRPIIQPTSLLGTLDFVYTFWPVRTQPELRPARDRKPISRGGCRPDARYSFSFDHSLTRLIHFAHSSHSFIPSVHSTHSLHSSSFISFTPRHSSVRSSFLGPGRIPDR